MSCFGGGEFTSSNQVCEDCMLRKMVWKVANGSNSRKKVLQSVQIHGQGQSGFIDIDEFFTKFNIDYLNFRSGFLRSLMSVAMGFTRRILHWTAL